MRPLREAASRGGLSQGVAGPSKSAAFYPNLNSLDRKLIRCSKSAA